MSLAKKLTLYDKILNYYINDAKGFIMAVTTDPHFLKALNGAFKTLGLSSNCISNRHSMEKAMAETRLLMNRFKQVILFVEASIDGFNNVLTIKNFKSVFTYKCKVIMITEETERDKIAQMYEMGADNVIVKPVSINSLIQKIALTLNPNNNIAKMVDQAKSMINSNKLHEAEKIADNILLEKPDSSIAYILKGDIARQRDKFEEAESHYMNASAHSKMYLEPLKKLAELYEQIENLEKRLEYLKKLDRLSPLNYERKIDIGQTYLKMDDEEQAKLNFDEAVRQVEKQARDLVSSTLMKIAKSVSQTNPKMSSDYISKAIDNKGKNLSREDLWMFNEIGINLRQQGKWEEAIAYYKNGLKISPMDAGLFYNMGMAYAQGKQYYKSLEHFQKALASNPDILLQAASIPYNIARVQIALNKHDEAGRYLKKALELEPDHAGAQKLMHRIQT